MKDEAELGKVAPPAKIPRKASLLGSRINQLEIYVSTFKSQPGGWTFLSQKRQRHKSCRQCLEKKEGRQSIGGWYLLVAQFMCDGKGQIETIVFGEHTFPLSTAHAS